MTIKQKKNKPKKNKYSRTKSHRSQNKKKKTFKSQLDAITTLLLKSSSSTRRFLIVWSIIILGIFGLGCRLFQLQIVKGPYLQERAREQQVKSLRPYIPRRSIIDRNKNILATDRFVYILDVHPKIFNKSKEEVAQELAKIIEDFQVNELIEWFNLKETGIRLPVNVTEADFQKIRQLRIGGIDLTPRYARFYPQQEMVAETVGYVDTQHLGKAGLEYSREELLERDVSSFKVKKAGNGQIIPADVPQGLLQLENLQLQLTLDLRLQRATRSALLQQMTKYNAERGAALVMDVTDGSLLALVCEPTYNPNRYFKYDIKLFRNWAVTDIYEPGSTFKPINVAIALDAGIIQPDAIIYDEGKIKVDIWDISNHDYRTKGGHGYLTIPQILQKSSNVGMIKIISKMDNLDYYYELKKLGLREKVGVDIPGDTPGTLKTQEEFTALPIEAATASFGQGFSLTALKLLQLHGAIANGGKLVTPHLVKGLVDYQGNFHWEATYPSKQVFTPETSQIVLEMMETVVENGSGKVSQIPGYRIAGKTGTAQKASPWGGYLPDAKITSFVAMLPVESPRYAVLVVVDEPKGEHTYGSTVAAPVAKEIMKSLIAIQGIPPSNDTSSR